VQEIAGKVREAIFHPGKLPNQIYWPQKHLPVKKVIRTSRVSGANQTGQQNIPPTMLISENIFFRIAMPWRLPRIAIPPRNPMAT